MLGYACPQDSVVCPYCVHNSRWPKRLREHVVRYHKRSFMVDGAETAKKVMFWRSKRGQRRLSLDSVKKVLDRKMKHSTSITRNEVFDIVTVVLGMGLVKIGNDQV